MVLFTTDMTGCECVVVNLWSGNYVVCLRIYSHCRNALHGTRQTTNNVNLEAACSR